MANEYTTENYSNSEDAGFETEISKPFDDRLDSEAEVVDAEIVEDELAAVHFKERVLFKAYHRPTGVVLIGTAPTLRHAIFFEQASREVMEEAGFELSRLPDGLAAREIPYMILVQLAYQICLSNRFGG